MQNYVLKLTSLLTLIGGLLSLVWAINLGGIHESLGAALNAPLLMAGSINLLLVCIGALLLVAGAYGLAPNREGNVKLITFREDRAQTDIRVDSAQATLRKILCAIPEVKNAKVTISPALEPGSASVYAEVVLRNQEQAPTRDTFRLLSALIEETAIDVLGLEIAKPVRVCIAGVSVNARQVGQTLHRRVSAKAGTAALETREAAVPEAASIAPEAVGEIVDDVPSGLQPIAENIEPMEMEVPEILGEYPAEPDLTVEIPEVEEDTAGLESDAQGTDSDDASVPCCSIEELQEGTAEDTVEESLDEATESQMSPDEFVQDEDRSAGPEASFSGEEAAGVIAGTSETLSGAFEEVKEVFEEEDEAQSVGVDEAADCPAKAPEAEQPWHDGATGEVEQAEVFSEEVGTADKTEVAEADSVEELEAPVAVEIMEDETAEESPDLAPQIREICETYPDESAEREPMAPEVPQVQGQDEPPSTLPARKKHDWTF